ncbi:glycosyltransferase family 4 protein [Candidatus Daviesbacteria bacterium]|nr:glycosyltransferase family 4 protein [Candidatus Daviesbacteria bacterium]
MKPKVAILRGPSLSKFEMQIYEPLTKWFNLTGIGSTKPLNDCTNIKFPILKLSCFAQFITRLPFTTHLMYEFFGDTQWLSGFSKAITGFNLLHSAEVRTGYTYQAIKAKKKGLVKAVTITVYENIPFVTEEYSIRKRIREEVISEIDHFLAANDQARQSLITEGADRDKISIIPQSVDTKIFKPAKKRNKLEKLRRKYQIKSDDFIILSVERIVWEKGPYDLVRAAAKIKKESSKKIKFILVGSGIELIPLKELIKRENLEEIFIFTGQLEYQKVPEIFQLADLFVHPSVPTRWWNEQFGGVLIEAMASGLPIIGTNSGGIVETVGKEGGVFIPPQNFSALADAINLFINNPKLRCKIGSRNREVTLKKYDIDVVAKNIKTIWEGILK